MLFEKGIDTSGLQKIIGAKQPKTAREKLTKVRPFKLPEMKAIKTELFPDMTLEEIFEGY